MMRGQGISINVIVITAIALIVLVVLIIVFSGRVGLFNKGLGTCTGFCTDSVAKCDGSPVPTQNCDDGKNPPLKGAGVCCMPT
jgi:hypothetical protein